MAGIDPRNGVSRRIVVERIRRLAPALEGIERWEPRIVEATSAARGLHEITAREHADLLVIGSTHDGALTRVVPGTVARRLLHGSPCPVAFAPRGFRPPAPGHAAVVGAAFDGSPESQAALEAAAHWARDLGARLRILTALERPSPASPMFGTFSYRKTIEAMRRTACNRLDAARRRLDVPAGVTTDLLEGDPVPALASKSEGLDLLLVGSRGCGPVRAVLLGGVSGPLLERASCPAMVVPRRTGVAGPERTVEDRVSRSVEIA
jgi:nucleotide-binding universal stress UspA family protein